MAPKSVPKAETAPPPARVPNLFLLYFTFDSFLSNLTLNSYMLSGRHEGVMSILDRVNAYLTVRRPSRFCDGCIAESLELNWIQQVREATSALGTTDSFHRALGVCSVCGKEKKVIQRA